MPKKYEIRLGKNDKLRGLEVDTPVRGKAGVGTCTMKVTSLDRVPPQDPHGDDHLVKTEVTSGLNCLADEKDGFKTIQWEFDSQQQEAKVLQTRVLD